MISKHDSTKCYLVKKTSEAVRARNETTLQTKNFSKALKLSRLSYQMEKARSAELAARNAKLNISPSLELGDKEKLSLSDID